jgi:hypothetical protein
MDYYNDHPISTSASPDGGNGQPVYHRPMNQDGKGKDWN